MPGLGREVVGAEAMNRPHLVLLLLLAAVCGGAPSRPAAQPQSVPGIIAKHETELLSYEDKLAAYDAEQAVLSLGWGTTGYHWKGPNGAYGTIISGSSLSHGDRRQCRRFIHIVHHANDGGLNPTFQGVVCRDEGREWQPE